MTYSTTDGEEEDGGYPFFWVDILRKGFREKEGIPVSPKKGDDLIFPMWLLFGKKSPIIH